MQKALNRFLNIYILVCLLCGLQLAADEPKVLEPSDLKTPCTLTDVEVYTDEIGSGHFVLFDSNGKTLKVGYNTNGVFFFTHEDKDRIKSEPGGPEEQILLRIIKQSYKAVYGDSTDRSIYDQQGEIIPTRRYWDKIGMLRFIALFEHRCKTKSE